MYSTNTLNLQFFCTVLNSELFTYSKVYCSNPNLM